MLQPKTTEQQLVDVLAKLYANQRVLSAPQHQMTIARLKREAKDLKLVDMVAGIERLSDIALLEGKLEEALQLGYEALSASGYSQKTVFNTIGLFQQAGRSDLAVATSERLNFRSLEYVPQKIAMCRNLCLQKAARELLLTIEEAKIGGGAMEEVQKSIQIMETLQRWGVSIEQARALFQAALSFLYGRGYLMHQPPVMAVDLAGELLWYEIPLNLEFSERWELSQEWADELFSRYPDAPVRNIHVNFVAAQHD